MIPAGFTQRQGAATGTSSEQPISVSSQRIAVSFREESRCQLMRETATLGTWQARQHLVRDVSQGVVESLVAKRTDC